jgi:hypothetical protein
MMDYESDLGGARQSGITLPFGSLPTLTEVKSIRSGSSKKPKKWSIRTVSLRLGALLLFCLSLMQTGLYVLTLGPTDDLRSTRANANARAASAQDDDKTHASSNHGGEAPSPFFSDDESGGFSDSFLTNPHGEKYTIIVPTYRRLDLITVSGLLVQQVSLVHTHTDYSLPAFYTRIPTTRSS